MGVDKPQMGRDGRGGTYILKKSNRCSSICTNYDVRKIDNIYQFVRPAVHISMESNWCYTCNMPNTRGKTR